MTHESSSTGHRRSVRIVAVIAAAIVVVLVAFYAFQRWQLRHSYCDRLRMSRHRSVFYSYRLIGANREEVRTWAEADLLANDPVSDGTVWKELRLIILLSSFAGEQDLDILLRKAEIGYPLPAQEETYTSRRGSCAIGLLQGIAETCVDVAGDSERGIALFHKSFRERKIAPYLMTLYEQIDWDHYLGKSDKEQPPVPTPQTPQPPADKQPLREDENE